MIISFLYIFSLPKNYNKIEDDLRVAKKLIYYYMFYSSSYFPVLDNVESDFGLDPYVFLNNAIILNESINSVINGINECL